MTLPPSKPRKPRRPEWEGTASGPASWSSGRPDIFLNSSCLECKRAIPFFYGNHDNRAHKRVCALGRAWKAWRKANGLAEIQVPDDRLFYSHELGHMVAYGKPVTKEMYRAWEVMGWR